MPGSVLIIAYYFPPIGGAGVQRTVKFAKYLPDNGWDPIILTVDGGSHISFDESLLAELPADLLVYRSRIFDPEDVREWWRSGSSKSLTEPSKGPQVIDSQVPEVTSGKIEPGLVARWKGTLAHFYLSVIPWLFVPDSKIGWLPYAGRLGGPICQDHGVSVLFSTSSPITSHLIAHRLKRLTGIPWVADFRDLWVRFPGYKPKSRIHGLLEKWIEGRIMANADRIIANTDVSREVMLETYPTLNPDHVITIPNGYDEADFLDLHGRPAEARFTITYTGNFYGNRNPINLFAAMEELLGKRPDVMKDILFRYIGPPTPFLQSDSWPERLKGSIQVEPYLPHRRSLEALSESDVLLLIDAPEFNVNIPGKVYEYLRIGRPILALIPTGATSDLLDRTGGARIVNPEDISAIADAILALYEFSKSPSPTREPDSGEVACFERRNLTSKLSRVFDAVGL
jgi:glycosyltransferase involved in cell wall biosynthesis